MKKEQTLPKAASQFTIKPRFPKFARLALLVCGILILLLESFFLYTWLQLRQNINVHVPPFADSPSKHGLESPSYFFSGPDGNTLAYWYFPVTEPKAVVIVVSGLNGPGGGKSLMLPVTKYLHDSGYSVMVVDLRSQGESDGNKVWLGAKEWQDLEAFYDQAKSLPDTQGKKIGLLGHSMGAATVVTTASLSGKSDFCISIAPFASIDHLLESQIRKKGFPTIPFLPLMKLAARIELGSDYDSRSPLKMADLLTIPCLYLSAKNDQDVFAGDARLLYDKAGDQKEWREIDSGHDVFSDNPTDTYKSISQFLDQVLSQ